MDDKKMMRKEVRKIEQNFADNDLKNANKKIADNLLSLSIYINAQVIFCFVGIGKEIDTRRILTDAWSSGKRVAVPRCLEDGIMKAYLISGFDDLEIGRWRLLEPKAFCAYMPPDSIDICIAPCLACDKKGNRLGKGGGYYDRYFSHCRAPIICLCREKLLFENIPVDEWDVPVNQIVTEKRIYFSSI